MALIPFVGMGGMRDLREREWFGVFVFIDHIYD